MTEVNWIHSAEELNDWINTEDEVILDITAPAWCVPCQRFAPHYETAAKTIEGKTFLAVDADEADWVMTDYNVRSVPTVLRFINGERVSDVAGRTIVALKRELS